MAEVTIKPMSFRALQVRAALLGLILGTSLFIFFWLRWSYFDAEDFYLYQGTEGPFSVTEVDGRLFPYQLISRAKPGEVIAWKTDICFKKDLSILGTSEFIRESDHHVISIVQASIAPGERECGIRTQTRQIPIDAIPGHYTIKRTIVLLPRGRAPVQAVLPGINIEIANAPVFN